MTRRVFRLLLPLAFGALAVLAPTGSLPALAARAPQYFDVTPSSYLFDSTGSQTLTADLPSARTGQLASVEIQTGFASWRVVGTATVGSDGHLSATVDALLGATTYRVGVGPRWNRAVSRPVTVKGSLHVQRVGKDVVEVSGRLPTAVRRPVILSSVTGEVVVSHTSGETDATGEFAINEVIDHSYEGLGVTAPAFTDENGQAWPEFRSDSKAASMDADAAPVRRQAPTATVGRTYSAQVRTEGFDGALSVTGGSLPPGLAVDPPSGVLSGTPTTSGLFTFTVSAAGYRPNTVGLAVERQGPEAQGRLRPIALNAYESALSGDGHAVLHDGPSSFLAGEDSSRQVYLVDPRTGVRRAIVHPAGEEPRDQGFALAAGLSADGRHALFTTSATLIPGDAGFVDALYLSELGTGRLIRVSAGSPEDRVLDDGGSVSAHGDVVTFRRARSGSPDQTDIFVWAATTGLRRIATVADDRTRAGAPQVSDDGRFVGFRQQAGPDSTVLRAALWERSTGRTTTLPTLPGGSSPREVDGLSATGDLALVSDGRQPYLWSRATGRYTPVPTPPALVAGTTQTAAAVLSHSGRYLLITSTEYDHHSVWRSDLADRSLIRLPSFGPTTSAYGQDSSGVAISDDGRTALLNQGGGVLQKWEPG